MGDSIQLMVGLLTGIVLGAGGALAVLWFQGQRNAKVARSQAEVILEDARAKADAARRQAELQIKEDMLRRREAADLELEGLRKGVREQERRLEKRNDLLDQKLEMINKKEREFERIEGFLTERQEELDRKGAELKQVMADQRETLHRLSGMQRNRGSDDFAGAGWSMS